MLSQDAINAIARVQKYIAEHIKEPITSKQLACVAGYSQYYCARIFKELTQKSPFEYIRSIRLSQAAMVLRDEKLRVLDVALDYVFDSHEGFTRAFSKEFGIAPKTYAQNPKPIRLFLPSNIKDFYRMLRYEGGEKEMGKAIFVQIVERPKRKLILKRGKEATDYFQYCEEVGCDVWGLLCSIKEALYEPVGMWLPDNMRIAGTSVYVQGVEVAANYSGEVPEGFDMLDLSACKMLIFQGQPYEDEDFINEIDELWQQTATYNPKIYGYEWDDEVAPRMQLEPQGYRGYIEMRPVREIG